MSGKKLVLESGQRYFAGGEAYPPKKTHYGLASFIEVGREIVYKKTERPSEGREKPARQEKKDEARVDRLAGQAQIINQVCAVLLKTIALLFTAAVAIAIFQALFL